MMRRVLVLAALASTLASTALVFHAGEVRAQTTFGAQAMFGSETDLGIGGRLQVPLGPQVPLDFQGGVNLFFPDGPGEYFEVNANLWYDIPTSGATNVVPYVGGGINLGHQRISGFSDTDVGLNLGGGARFVFANTTPFIEARFVVSGSEQFVIGGGVLFRGF